MKRISTRLENIIPVLLMITLIVLLTGILRPPIPALAQGTRIIFLHHSCGENLIEQGDVREGLSQLGYEFFDHGYNDDGLRLADGSNSGMNFDVPGDNTDPDGLAEIFNQPLNDPPDNTFSYLMQYDVILFKSCYPTSNIESDEQLGEYQAYYRSIRERMRDLWPSVAGDAVLGLGFPNPIMARYGREAMRALIAQPAQQGADWWGTGGGNATTLVFEDELPFADEAFDRVVAMHLLENTESLASTLEEIWRVLAPEGRFIAIVPNRRSLWARLERTPFAHGRPFSHSQLIRTLSDTGFVAERHAEALFFPPSKARVMLRLAGPWENFMKGTVGHMGGLHIVEAVTRVEGWMPTKGLRVRLRVPKARPVLQPALPATSRS